MSNCVLPLSSNKSDVSWLELGAQWLHGQGSHLYRIAESNSLISDVTSSEGLGKLSFKVG